MILLRLLSCLPLENFLAHEIEWHVGYMYTMYNSECCTAQHGQYLMNSLSEKSLGCARVSMATSYCAVPDIWFSLLYLFYLFFSSCSITTGLFNMFWFCWLYCYSWFPAVYSSVRESLIYILASPLAGFSLISHFDVSHTHKKRKQLLDTSYGCCLAFSFIYEKKLLFILIILYYMYIVDPVIIISNDLFSAGHVFFYFKVCLSWNKF